MRIATTLFVSCLLAACYGQLLPCAPNCRHEDDGTLFPNPRECSRFFQCAYHIAVPHKCPDGLFYNPVVQVCDFPDSAGCVLDPDCSDGNPTTTAAPVQTTTTIVDTTVDATTAPTVPTGRTTTVLYTTSKVLVTTVQSTTTPDAVTTTTQPAVTTTAVYSTTDQPTVPTSVSPDSTTVSGECRPDCPSAEAMFPNPRDCSSFFKCAFGHPFLLHCPAGQWYDGPNERCDYIELVECNAGPDAPCVAVTNPTGPPQETTTVVSGSTTTDGGDDCVPPCPSDEALYPNPRDCGSFYQCAFGVPFLLKCPAGQEYAAALERCDYPEVAQCTAGPDSPCVAVTIPPQIVFRIR